jgi:hypothetical protein
LFWLDDMADDDADTVVIVELDELDFLGGLTSCSNTWRAVKLMSKQLLHKSLK